MGDAPTSSTSAGDSASQGALSGSHPEALPHDEQASYPPGSNHQNHLNFQAQYPQGYDPSQSAFSNQFDMAHAQSANRQGPYNMTNMMNALPQQGYRPSGYPSGQQHRFNTAGPNMVQPMAQYPMAGQQYYVPQPQHIGQYYSPQMSMPPQHHQPPNLSPRHARFYPGHGVMTQSQNAMPAGYYYLPPQPYSSPPPAMAGHMASGQYIIPETAGDGRGTSSSAGNDSAGGVAGATSPTVPQDNRSNIVRGPPRKPRQSGHAIWIGNLPPQADLMTLVQHVCKETEGLESLFLISKSNCAFANFKSEQDCIAAQQKLHDSKFQSVRLVSRLRKSTVEGSSGQTAPTGPAASSSSALSPTLEYTPSIPDSTESPATSTVPRVEPEDKVPQPSEQTPQKDRFFILKSLTVEDLDLSVRNGVWATQSHNEETLNKAFASVDNVYLVFSANKSGEYFGYARMISPIDDDPAAAIEFAPQVQATNDVDLPKAIPTEGTDNCPRGRIIDDSARGTIFWEIERDDADGETETDSEDTESSKSGLEESGGKAWGKPFKLEWMSTTRLPFYRARGLRNPWNSNREVKIARDGTELEPSVGRRLIGLFNRVQSPAPAVQMGMRPGMAMVAGYPPPMPAPYPPR